MIRPLATLLALLLSSPPALPQEEKKPPKKQEADDLKTRTEKHKKDVVALRGLDFKKDVTVGVYTKKELVDFLKGELERELPREKADVYQRAYAAFGLIPKDMDLLQALMDLYGGSIAGFYHPETKELRLIKPGEEEAEEGAQLKSMGIDLEAVTLVHELTHAAQDQHFELSTLPLEDETNDDLIMALKGVIEGDASCVGWKYGFKGLFKTLMPKYNELLKMGELPGKANELPAYLRLTLTFPYGHGTDFVLAYLDKNGGSLKGTSKLFEDLPLSSEQILHPEKYLDAEKRDNPVIITLPGLAALFGGGWKETLQNVHGEFVVELMLREALGKESPLPAKAAAGWDGDRYVAFEDDKKKTAVVWISTWDSEDDAKEFHDAYARVLKKQLGPPAESAEGKPLVYKDGGFLEHRGSDVLVLLGAPDGLAGKSDAIWKLVRKTELTKVERVPKFVCAKCDVKEAFSGKCSKCQADLKYVPKDPPPRKVEKKKREYGVNAAP